jgi:hypothetical protein
VRKDLNRKNDTVSYFKDNVPLTLRFGNLLTLSNVGDFLLVDGYQSMEAIQKAYDVIGSQFL